MVHRNILSVILSALFCASAVQGFAPRQAPKPVVAPLEATSKPLSEKLAQFAATTAAVVATSPLMALAEEVDDYEYGAVNAPIGLAWGAGVLAVATALLPLALQGGEEAFEEEKERLSGTWGTGNSDALNRRGRR